MANLTHFLSTKSAPIKKANSPYGNTKQICEEILQDSLESSPDNSAISLRYFNPIGAHPSARIGELPMGTPNNLVPFITQAAIGIREYLRVFGDDYNTPDGSAIRDYINVVDLSRAHVISIKRLLNNKQKSPFEVFNLGTGEVFLYLKLSKHLRNLPDKNSIIRWWSGGRAMWNRYMPILVYANSELGWKAEKGIEETLLSAWDWETSIYVQKMLYHDDPINHRGGWIHRIPCGEKDGSWSILISGCSIWTHLPMQGILRT